MSRAWVLVAAVTAALAAVRAAPAPLSGAACNSSLPLGFYQLTCDAAGNIVSPWGSKQKAMAAEVDWYMAAPPASHGYPTYAYSTFVDGNRRLAMCAHALFFFCTTLPGMPSRCSLWACRA